MANFLAFGWSFFQRQKQFGEKMCNKSLSITEYIKSDLAVLTGGSTNIKEFLKCYFFAWRDVSLYRMVSNFICQS